MLAGRTEPGRMCGAGSLLESDPAKPVPWRQWSELVHKMRVCRSGSACGNEDTFQTTASKTAASARYHRCGCPAQPLNVSRAKVKQLGQTGPPCGGSTLKPTSRNTMFRPVRWRSRHANRCASIVAARLDAWPDCCGCGRAGISRAEVSTAHRLWSVHGVLQSAYGAMRRCLVAKAPGLRHSKHCCLIHEPVLHPPATPHTAGAAIEAVARSRQCCAANGSTAAHKLPQTAARLQAGS